jgi:hypothetical protein
MDMGGFFERVSCATLRVNVFLLNTYLGESLPIILNDDKDEPLMQ